MALVMSTRTPPRILSIAGSDSSGGAGIQADIKTITMLGGYAMTAITAATAQNTLGVQAITPLSGEFVGTQIASCIDDIGVDAIKIGRSEEHTSELQSLMRISYAVFCLKHKINKKKHT